MAFAIKKVDPERQIVYGLVDVPADADPTSIEQAISGFMLQDDPSLAYGGDRAARVVASMPTVPDVMRAFFGPYLDARSLAAIPTGWIVGLHFDDRDAFQGVADGRIRATPQFSTSRTINAATLHDAGEPHDNAISKNVSREREDTTMAIESVRKKAADAIEERAEHLRMNDPSYRTKYGKPLTKAQAYARAILPPNRGGDKIAHEAAGRYQDSLRQGIHDDLTAAEPPNPRLSKSDSAWARIEALADGMVRKSDDHMTRARAIDVVMAQRPDLVREHYRAAHGRDPWIDPAARR